MISLLLFYTNNAHSCNLTLRQLKVVKGLGFQNTGELEGQEKFWNLFSTDSCGWSKNNCWDCKYL